MHTQPSDRELLAAVADDAAAFEVFYRRHVDQLVRFVSARSANPHEVADVVASTFVVVLTDSGRYDPARGDARAWLLGIAARLIANTRRRDGRERAAVARLAARGLLDADDYERLEEQIDAHRSTRAMRGALASLSDSQREALLLVGPAGLTPAAAARTLGISAPAFRMRLASARRAVRRHAGRAASGDGADPAHSDPAPSSLHEATT
jgi:RNA polymerase sigma factor (sigma-70 family)